MKEILLVCTGNTCRSPMAEFIFNTIAEKEGLDVRAVSAGVSVPMPMPASHGACAAAERRGGDLSRHVSRQVNEDMLRRCSAVYCMTGAHARLLINRFPEFEDKVFLFSQRDISDPFGGDDHDYERAACEIEAAVENLVRRMRKESK